MTGIELIAQERKEQIEKHGWTLEHNRKEHPDGELSLIAAYLSTAEDGFIKAKLKVFVPEWGMDLCDKLKNDTIHRLKVAGALIAAEIDRLQGI